MADTQDQITNLDAELDALSSPSTGEVYARSRDYDADVVAASAVARAAAGGGGGGSQPFKVVRVPIAFDTPDLVLTGITLTETSPGEVLLSWLMSITTPWDGTTPKITQGTRGPYGPFSTDDLAYADIGEGNTLVLVNGNGTMQLPTPLDDGQPLYVMVDDGSGGDPGSTQGEGFIILQIVTAA